MIEYLGVTSILYKRKISEKNGCANRLVSFTASEYKKDNTQKDLVLLTMK